MDRPLPLTASLAAVVRRLALPPHRDRFVLRGGMVAARYLAPSPRAVEDVDLLAPVEVFEPERLTRWLVELLAEPGTGDRAVLRLDGTELTWMNTPFPGLRALLGVDGDPCQVDIGFGDPLVGGPVELDVLPGVTVPAVRAETLAAWKVHGLFERGDGSWRPKDLDDLDRLLRLGLDPGLLTPAIAVAFGSRDDPLDLAGRLLAGEMGRSPWSNRKWATFGRRRALVPLDPLPEVVARVAAALRSVWPEPVPDPA